MKSKEHRKPVVVFVLWIRKLGPWVFEDVHWKRNDVRSYAQWAEEKGYKIKITKHAIPRPTNS